MSSASGTPAPLLPRIAQGDGSAVREAIQRYSPLIWSVARGFFPDRTMAEDTVQEIFIDLWKSADRYDPERSSEVNFVATVARRRLIDKRRRIARQPDIEDFELAGDKGIDDQSLDRLEVEDEAQRARQALGRLKPEQRKLLELSVLHGWTHPQIAASEGLPLGTVKSHIKRGLDQVRELLATSRSPEVAS